MRTFFITFLPFVLVACPSSPKCPEHSVVCPNDDVIADSTAEDNEEPEGSALTPAGKVCKNLRAIGCPEGSVRKDQVGETRNCTTTVQKALDDHLTKVPVDCLIQAKTKVDVRHCGSFVPCQ